MLGGGGSTVAVALSVWLTTIASPEIAPAVGGVAGLAVAALVVGLVLGRREAIAPALLGLGAAYAVVLALDDPPLDPRAAIIGATLLTIGELSHLAIDARPAIGDDGGSIPRRVGWVAATALGALVVGGALVVTADLVRTGGIAIEVTGAAAAAAAVALLVSVGRKVRQTP